MFTGSWTGSKTEWGDETGLSMWDLASCDVSTPPRCDGPRETRFSNFMSKCVHFHAFRCQSISSVNELLRRSFFDKFDGLIFNTFNNNSSDQREKRRFHWIRHVASKHISVSSIVLFGKLFNSMFVITEDLKSPYGRRAEVSDNLILNGRYFHNVSSLTPGTHACSSW